MKQLAKIRLYILLTVVLISLCACQQSPDAPIVISKNDGAFDANAAISADEHHEAGKTQSVSVYDQFTSTDGSVTFLMSIDTQLTGADMPVLEVEPHFLTVQDAQNIAHALFGDATLYEAEPSLSEHYSKGEIQKKIDRWSEYTTGSAIRDLYGYDPGSNTVELVKAFIERYRTLYEFAPTENPHTLCQWTFRKASEYTVLQEDRVGLDLSGDNDEICLQLEIDGIPYHFMVSNRDQSDFRVNMVTACIYDGLSPDGIDESIFMAKLCRTPEPTEAQLTQLQQRASQILEEMELGQWKIDQCYVQTRSFGSTPEYVVCVNAVPVLNGGEVIRQPQLTSLRNPEGYAADYYYTDVNFQFSANGDLISFMLYSPLDVKEVLNENVAVLPMEEMMDTARRYLQYSDCYAYGFGDHLDQAGEKLSCTVTVSQLDYNLIRVRVPNSDTDFYYVPGIILRGQVQYAGSISGTVYYESKDLETLVAINGVDGTIISLED